MAKNTKPGTADDVRRRPVLRIWLVGGAMAVIALVAGSALLVRGVIHKDLVRKEVHDLLARQHPPADTVEKRQKRKNGIPQEILDSWGTRLQLGNDGALFFLADYNPIFKDDVFQLAALERCFGRFKLVPKTDVDKWREPLARLVPAFKTPGFATDLVIRGLLAGQDRLFAGETFKVEESDRLQARIGTIPPQAIKDFARTLHPRTPKNDGGRHPAGIGSRYIINAA